VVRIEPGQARIVVGPRRALAVEAMRVAEWNWLGEEQRDVGVKVRSLAPPVAATRDGDWLHFRQSEYGVAPGQAAVLYEGTRLLGGGWIAETVSAAEDAMNAAAA
jgi:tRNA-specific 2-thiouridylase